MNLAWEQLIRGKKRASDKVLKLKKDFGSKKRAPDEVLELKKDFKFI